MASELGRLRADDDRDVTAATGSSALEDRPQGYDLVVDATGVPAAIEAVFGAVAKGGRFLQVGVAPPEASACRPRPAAAAILPYRIYYEEITVVGSMAVLDSYAPALQLIADGTVKVGPLFTTTTCRCSPTSDGYEALRRGDGLKKSNTPTALTHSGLLTLTATPKEHTIYGDVGPACSCRS